MKTTDIEVGKTFRMEGMDEPDGRHNLRTVTRLEAMDGVAMSGDPSVRVHWVNETRPSMFAAEGVMTLVKFAWRARAL